MGKTSNITNGILKGLMVLVVLSGAALNFCSAQILTKLDSNLYIGIEGSFGMRSFTLSSNFSAIDRLHVVEAGGSIGLVFGGEAVRARIKQGYYCSTSSVVQTVDLVESEGALTLYFLQIGGYGDRTFEPYLIVGAERSSTRLYGFYANGNEGAKINYSVSDEPYIGKIITSKVNLGAGLEYRLPGPKYFFNVFGEVKYGCQMGTNTNYARLKETTASNVLSMNIGVSIGYHKIK